MVRGWRLRWLVCAPGPAFSVHDVYIGWVEALREVGETVREFPLGDLLTFYDTVHIDRNGSGEYEKALSADQAKSFAVDRLAAALYKVRPQVLLLVSGFFAEEDLLEQARRSGTRVVLLHTESPYEDERQLELAPYADLNLLNDPTHLAAFEALAPTVYAPHAYRPSVHYPGGTPTVDFSFVGTGYPSRVEFFEQLNLDGLSVKLAGNWMRLPDEHPLRGYLAHNIDECFDNADAAPLYRSTRVGLNLYRREAEAEDLIAGWSMGPREVEMAACRTFFLRDPRPEGDEVFPMLPTFVGAGDASEKLRWWLAHPNQREKAAKAAREAVADRTFTNHARKLLRLFDRQPANV